MSEGGGGIERGPQATGGGEVHRAGRSRVDFERLRGRNVYLLFSLAQQSVSGDERDSLKNVYAEYSRKEFDVVLVSYDTEKKK